MRKGCPLVSIFLYTGRLMISKPKHRSRSEFASLNVIVGVGGYAINALLALACRMVFTRFLSQDYLGLASLLTSYLSMLSLVELGIGGAIVYALYRPIAENDEEKIKTLIRFYRNIYFGIGGLIAAVGVASLPFLDVIVGDAGTVGGNLYLIYCIYLFNTASGYFFSYRGVIVIATQRSYITTGLSYLTSYLQNIVQAIVLIATSDFILYLAVQTFFTQLYNVLIFIISGRMFPFLKSRNVDSLPKDERNRLLRDVKALAISKFGGVLVGDTDYIVITFFKGLAVNGLVSNYTLVSGMVSSLMAQVFNSLTASVGNLCVSRDVKKQLETFESINLANFMLFGWFALLVCFTSTDLVVLFFGDSYKMPQEIPLIIALNFYMVGMQDAVWTFKAAKGLFRYGQYLLLLTALINLGLDLLLGYYMGVVGVLVASAIARGLTNTWYDPYAVYKYGFKTSPVRYLKKYLNYLLVIVFCGFVCGVLCSYVELGCIGNLVTKGLICTLVFSLVFFLCFRSTRSFKSLKPMFVSVLNAFWQRVKWSKK